MRIEESCEFFMFVYEDKPELVAASLGAFYNTIGSAPIQMTVMNNYPGWELPERYGFIKESFPKARVHNNLMNQGQARNWNQIARLALMDGKRWVGILTPDTQALPGWIEAANARSDLHLINHLNFSIFRPDTCRSLGWFDERHVSGGSEDLDYYMRLEEAGLKYDRFVFRDAKCEIRDVAGNQYRESPEKHAQFEADVNYWKRKWTKTPGDLPNSDLIYFHRENRRRNWPDINWYPKILDRHLVK